MNDSFILGGVTLASRLFIGTGKYGTDNLIPAVAEASGAEVITVAMRRVDKQTGEQQTAQGIMSKRQLGNLVLVGDFSTDVLLAPPLAPRVTEAAALLADAVLEMVLGAQDMG